MLDTSRYEMFALFLVLLIRCYFLELIRSHLVVLGATSAGYSAGWLLCKLKQKKVLLVSVLLCGSSYNYIVLFQLIMRTRYRLRCRTGAYIFAGAKQEEFNCCT